MAGENRTDSGPEWRDRSHARLAALAVAAGTRPTRQLAAILERRRPENGEASDGWVFPSRISRSGRVADLSHMYEAISRTGGEKFWFHGLRNCFITVAERDLLLPLSLTKRLVNHARPSDVTEGYAADWTIAQLREPAQRIADRIEALMMTRPEPASPAA